MERSIGESSSSTSPPPQNNFLKNEEDSHKNYIDGLQQQVEYLKMKDPAKYQKYQNIGESLMDCGYNLSFGIDKEGDEISAKKLLYTIRDYGMEDDLSSEELNLLIRVYGIEWKKKIDGL